MSRTRRALTTAFIVLGQLAALLNALAAVNSARKGMWTIAALYLVIALVLCCVSVLAWYVSRVQRPYRWRP